LGLNACVRASDGTTPPEVEGPFYPVLAQKDRDFDLTQVEGQDGVSECGKYDRERALENFGNN